MDLIAFLLAVGFFSGVLGYHTRPFNTLLGLIFLALFLRPYISRDAFPGFRRHWPASLLAAVALVGVFHTTGWVGALFISLLIGGIRLSQPEKEQEVYCLGIYQTTAFAFGVFLWFWRETATGWYLLDGMARCLMWVTHHLGLKATLGPTALGMPAVVLVFIFGAARTCTAPSNRLQTVLKLVMALLVVQIAFVALHVVVARALSMTVITQQAQGAMRWYPFKFLDRLYPNNLQGIALLLGFGAIHILTSKFPHVRIPENLVRATPRASIVGAAALLVGVALTGYIPPRPTAHGEVLVYDAGYLSFRMPVFGRYGQKSGGMFGRLPGFLEAGGYRVKRGLVSPENLRSANVLVVINLIEKFDPPTKQAIWDFVRRGGSLLVLGDHTATDHIREPLNDLLKPVNIELNFDSAKPFRDGWLSAYAFPRHTITRGISDTINEVQIWIGASLTVSPPARPVIIGSYGFSDPGDVANAKRGNLGNLRFDPGEKLGDVPLAAECRYGKGRVLVFGDTSSVQNGALVYSHQFVDNMFAWLASPHMPSADPVRRGCAALLILAAIILLALPGRVQNWPTMAAAAILLGWALGTAPSRVFSMPSTAQNVAWIDASHLERFNSNNIWADESFGGLAYNLMRNGYSPLVMRDWQPCTLNRGSLLILIGPSKPFSPGEVKVIRRFVEGGGWLVLAAGWEDLSGSMELWREFGLRVEERPLGRVLVEQPGGNVRLYKGWSIEILRGEPQVLCSPWGYPAIVRLQVGKGSVVAIADTQFLLNRNLEGTKQYYPENIAFLHRLFLQCKQNGSGSIED